MVRPRRLVRLALIFAAAPVITWLFVVAVLPTTCLRNRIIACLTRETGRTVRLEKVRLGVLGGLKLQDLEIGERDRVGDPWLRVGEMRLHVSPLQLVLGRIEPHEVEVRGAVLRIERRPSGSFECADLLRMRQAPGSGGSRLSLAAEDADGRDVKLRILEGRVSLIDDQSGTRLELLSVQGRGTWRRDRVIVEELSGRVDGGRFELAAHLDRGPGDPRFEGQLSLERVVLGSSTQALGYILPVLRGPTRYFDRRLNLTLYLRGHGDSARELFESLVGQGRLAVSPISLEESPLLAELDKIGLVPPGRRVGSIQGQFTINDGRVLSQDLTITIAQVPIVLSGWTDFRGRVDYRVQSETIAQRVAPELKQALADLPGELEDVLNLRVRGTLDHMVLLMDGVPIGQGGPSPDPARLVMEKARLREVGRRLRNRLLR
jgi:AsmA protein